VCSSDLYQIDIFYFRQRSILLLFYHFHKGISLLDLRRLATCCKKKEEHREKK